jgi:serine/threonine protein kinase/tetratricopeptide (TPR) repeat protein
LGRTESESGAVAKVSTDLRARLESHLGAAYVIEGEIGAGAMGRVFLATEAALGRRVAVKVLRAEFASGRSLERFQREILLTARLQHPNIVPIFRAGDLGGLPFFTMPFVEGESLRERLGREARIPLAEALAIGREVADALDYAHREGIVHRDIKPENILLSRGHALVTDFGVARAVSALTGDALTEVGLAIGTPAYMSPEQVAGEREIDGRSDVYALACVLYEMLAGEPPFAAPTLQATLMRRLTEPPPPLSAAGAGTPSGVDAAVARALSTEPDQRFPTAAAFGSALVASQSLGAVVVPAPHERDRSIVVLPLASMSPDPENEFLADAVTDEIITDLSRVRAFRVISRHSAMRYKGTAKDTQTIGRELNVRYLLEGSVRRAGRSLRVTVQLVEADCDCQIWAERFTGTVDDVFEIQEQIARRVAGALEVRLTPEDDRRLATHSIENIQAYEWYLRARQLNLRFRPDALAEALALVDRATALDGERAPLLALKGYLLWNLKNVGMCGPETLHQAAEYVDRALAIDPELGTALVARAMLEVNAESVDSGLILRLLKRAWDADRSADAAMWLTFYLTLTGRPDAAEPYGRLIRELDPLNPVMSGIEGLRLLHLGRGEEAFALAAPFAASSADDQVVAFHVGYSAASIGRTGEARELLRRCASSDVWGRLAALHLASLDGDRESVARIVAEPELCAAAWLDDHFASLVAEALAHAGWLDQALRWLRRAADRGLANAPFVARHSRLLQPLRSHPELPALIEYMERRAGEIAAASGL